MGPGERKQQNARTDCIMMSFMTRTIHHDQIKEDKMGGACSSRREKRNAYRVLVRKTDGKRPHARPRRRLEDTIITNRKN